MTIDTTVDWVVLATTIGFAGLLGALIAVICVEGRHDRQAADAKALHAHLARIERTLAGMRVQSLARPEPTVALPRCVEDRLELGWRPPAPTTRVERRQMTAELTVASVPVPMRHRPAFRATLAEIGVAL